MAQALLTIGTVSKTAGLARQTIYNWCRAGLIEPSFRVEDTAVFTPAERDRIAALAKERAATRAKLRLAPNGNGATHAKAQRFTAEGFPIPAARP